MRYQCCVSTQTYRVLLAEPIQLVRCLQRNWCQGFEQFWPSSVINHNVRRLYYADQAGMVLSADAPVLCACSGDCNSNTVATNFGPGHRGCNPRECCDYPPRTLMLFKIRLVRSHSYCPSAFLPCQHAARSGAIMTARTRQASWARRYTLRSALALARTMRCKCRTTLAPLPQLHAPNVHLALFLRSSHAHSVIDNLSVEARLPGSIWAFFYMSPSSEQVARRLHASFLRQFGLRRDAVPLVHLNLSATRRLFSAADQDAE